MNKIKLILIFSYCFSYLISFAQPDFTMPSLRNTYQASYTNPAFIPKFKVSIGLPVVSNIYVNQTRLGFTLQDVFDNTDTAGYVNLNDFQQDIKGDGIGLITTVNTDLLHVSFALGNFQISVNSSIKQQTSQFFNKEFIGFAVNGNAYLAGKSSDFEAFKIYNISYVENGFSIAKQFGKLSLGVRAKYLQGLAFVETKNVTIGITTPTNSFDPIVINAGGTINTAGLPLLAGDSVEGMPKDESLKEFNVNNFTNFGNGGFGLDVGFTYQVLKKLGIHASVVDWGGIKWKTTPYSYTLQNSNVQFNGFSSDQLNSDSARNQYTDSLISLFGKTSITSKSFNTKLNTRYFIGADFDLTKHDRIGFLFQGQQFTDKFVPAYTFSYTHSFGKIWDITANYSIYNKTNNNVGVGTALKLGPLQLYFMTDDLFCFITPETRNTVYLRFGLNLLFGQRDTSKKQ